MSDPPFVSLRQNRLIPTLLPTRLAKAIKAGGRGVDMVRNIRLHCRFGLLRSQRHFLANEHDRRLIDPSAPIAASDHGGL